MGQDSITVMIRPTYVFRYNIRYVEIRSSILNWRNILFLCCVRFHHSMWKIRKRDVELERETLSVLALVSYSAIS